MSIDLYQEAIVALAKKARRLARLENPDRTATIDNPLCGDRVTLDLKLDGNLVTEIGHKTRGCLLCEASAFLIADHGIGQELAALKTKAPEVICGVGDRNQALADLWPGLQTLEPVRDFKSRYDCVTLPFKALIKLLEDDV
ncbi:MAG: iron-sulfur cluster assembly scaffold protein [Geminicoccales bacterium]